MKPDLQIFDSPELLAEGFASELVQTLKLYIAQNGKVNIALSGGNTPKLFFQALAKIYKNKIDWNYVYIYWVDERCVGTGDPESNYGMTLKYLIGPININSRNVFRIAGEAEPDGEAKRYSDLVKSQLPETSGIPQFDLVLLGMGSDGHTASIFPGHIEQFESSSIYDTAVNPASGQKRITMTGKVINNAVQVYFIISGKDKAEVLKEVLDRPESAKLLPAFYVQPVSGKLKWFIDKDAASKLTES